MRKSETKKHPSYGLIGFSRTTVVNDNAKRVFGSTLEHGHQIVIQVHRACVTSVDPSAGEFIAAKNQVLEIAMSTAQFADFITSGHCGDGVPCTLKWLLGEGKIEPCPPACSPTKEALVDFNHVAARASEKLDVLINELAAAASDKGLGKTSTKALLEKARMVKQDLEKDLPHVAKEFVRTLEDIIVEAKSAVNDHAKSIGTPTAFGANEELAALTSDTNEKT